MSEEELRLLQEEAKSQSPSKGEPITDKEIMLAAIVMVILAVVVVGVICSLIDNLRKGGSAFINSGGTAGKTNKRLGIEDSKHYKGQNNSATQSTFVGGAVGVIVQDNLKKRNVFNKAD